jgi:3-carboxy-cis,cis-muconate cycloisomerase
MSVSPFDSKLFETLLSDTDMAALFSDSAAIAAMLKVEVALAKVQAQVGATPQIAYEQIAGGLVDFTPDPADLARRTADFGVPVPALLSAAREVIGEEGRHYLHWGPTSQDVVDTALVLRLRKAIAILDKRMATLLEKVDRLSAEHADTLMVARARWQQALPTTFGYKIALWAEPIRRHRERLDQLKPRLLVLSLGGAAGTLAALGKHAEAVEKGLAEELDLARPRTPWHTQRDAVVEFAGWLSMLTGSLGKIGQDMLLMAQSEVGELRFASGGGSSTMPQKSNPIGAEVLVTLSRLNAGLVGVVNQAQIQEHERGGAGWMLEWLVLPQMIMAAATALKHADLLFSGIRVNVDRMRDHLEQSNGLTLAEAAVFALSAHMPKPDAQDLVKRACRQSRENNTHLIDILAGQVDYPIDWKALKNPGKYTGVAARRATP